MRWAFCDDVAGDEANLRDTSVMAVRRMIEIAEWTAPLIVLLYAFAASRKIASRTFRFYDFIFPMFVAGFLLFPTMGGNRYGPRYYFEAYPFFVLTIVSAVVPYLTSKADSIKAGFLAGALMLQVVLACIIAPIQVYENHRIVNERMALYDAVRDQKISHAVVIVRAGTGSILPVAPLDLTRNGIDPVEAEVIFAVNQFDQGWYYATGREAPKGDMSLEELIHAFPDRAFYVFEQSGGKGPAQLHRLALPM